ncbi:bifunctional hydroxy-methylpyrimidine kinase/ hydroxy-phosphomethylpyrimidine kinase [Bacillus safensis FO-36b]|uniref:bifunctional hydroxymethylpyrimidine kinase/phosphomethylpyrimidine kinase n=1 Tax=Bacillus TaxID=1386 RepID=UPI00045D002A|nr:MULTISPECIES: bifunctional hydroxymethylpyrimidine kinase/phosphomethylpyrimidine kinase [Bacillus]AWI36260.1 phosphomethylpyrimidine kinase [Bacillus safensis FO-36b]KDE27094.1 bifunctional hydroxy-methylpyrimidine kinase/ hydroxy-phosphomethylpyrimidine kinase [Bacillus safensis FO-36b]MCM3047638.1 bifunctional hydroxymethylpyrimidine kinase/phosphomethylpyrimidine kinase [Bacillus safensis]MDV3450619.1 bifunctional hydroxymethylpyrimidine kinase/phosphomethylpyrimidine kinase [Bacillus sa
MTIKKAFTIAGSDSGGGAGIQADLKTFQELGVYGMSAITAITAQNTLGVHGIYPLSIEALERQIDAVAEDLPPDAVKTGMLWSADMIKIVAEKTVQYEMKLIVDPVMIAKGGASLLNEDAVSAMKTHLLPVSYAVTPNLPEAEVLTGIRIQTKEDRYVAAERLYELGTKHVVIKGGHGPSDGMISDLLYDGKGFIEVTNEHIDTPHTHGTGCTFAAALTAEIAKGYSMKEAFETAETFVHEAIKFPLRIGSGHGPTNHFAYQQNRIKR